MNDWRSGMGMFHFLLAPMHSHSCLFHLYTAFRPCDLSMQFTGEEEENMTTVKNQLSNIGKVPEMAQMCMFQGCKITLFLLFLFVSPFVSPTEDSCSVHLLPLSAWLLP